MTDYDRIEKAITFLEAHFKEQPKLTDVAGKAFLSPFHFQRLFKEWAGVSPKKFLQFLSIEYAKKLLRMDLPLTEISYETGLSSTSRLHDLFVSIEGMTPGAYKNGGENLCINYSFAETIFGDVIIASTDKGVCLLHFSDHADNQVQSLVEKFPHAKLTQKTDIFQQNALRIFSSDWTDLQQVKLHLKGTEFQLKVWQALLKIPAGTATSYAAIAKNIDRQNASRAVGSAIGNNPVAFLIPCHRVIQSTGYFGEYHWGSTRKKAIMGWEAARLHGQE